eukprot:CAMPEP_0117437086 /NCGR_PEP_ID=MMETSP0759-20121206/1340_1 /TAXON_ID=63605 /ORGANISM="Percolomonas cosmopolitus, Strain WS" /LENGTH=1348 /DNA_ID=CAMNT_0005228703 /DNA_START=268 /DNA_END=4314 /DNA_ORIENTATION=+
MNEHDEHENHPRAWEYTGIGIGGIGGIDNSSSSSSTTITTPLASVGPTLHQSHSDDHYDVTPDFFLANQGEGDFQKNPVAEPHPERRAVSQGLRADKLSEEGNEGGGANDSTSTATSGGGNAGASSSHTTQTPTHSNALSHTQFLSHLQSLSSSPNPSTPFSLLSYDPTTTGLPSSDASSDHSLLSHKARVGHLLEFHENEKYRMKAEIESYPEKVAQLMLESKELALEHERHDSHIKTDIMQWKELIRQRETNISMARKAMRRLSEVKQDFEHVVVSDSSYALRQYHEELKSMVKSLTLQLENISADKQKFERREVLWRKHSEEKNELLVTVLKREESNISKLRQRLYELQQMTDRQQVRVHSFFEKAVLMDLNAYNCYEGYKLCMEEAREEAERIAANMELAEKDGREVDGGPSKPSTTPSKWRNDPSLLKILQEAEILQNETKLEKFLAKFPYNLKALYVQPKAEDKVSHNVQHVREWMTQKEREAMVLTPFDLEEIMMAHSLGDKSSSPYVSLSARDAAILRHSSHDASSPLRDVEGREVFGAGYSTYSPRGPLNAEYPSSSMGYPNMMPKHQDGHVQSVNYNEFEKERIRHSLNVANQKKSRVEGIPLSHYSPSKKPQTKSPVKSEHDKRRQSPSSTSKRQTPKSPTSPRRKRRNSRSSKTTSPRGVEKDTQSDTDPAISSRSSTAERGDATRRLSFSEGELPSPSSPTMPPRGPPPPHQSLEVDVKRIEELESTLLGKESDFQSRLQSSDKTINEQKDKIQYLEKQMKSSQAQVENVQQLEKKLIDVKQKSENQKQIFEEQTRKKDEQIQQLKALLQDAQQETASLQQKKKGKKSDNQKPPRGGGKSKKSKPTQDVSKLDFERLHSCDAQDGADPNLILSPLSSATEERASSRISTGRRAKEELQTISEIENQKRQAEWITPDMAQQKNGNTKHKKKKKKSKASHTLKLHVHHRASTNTSSSRDDEDDVSSRLSSDSQFDGADGLGYDEVLLRAMEGSPPGGSSSHKYEYEPRKVGILLSDADSSITPHPWNVDQMTPLRRYTDVPVPIESENGVISYTKNIHRHHSKSKTKSMLHTNSPSAKTAVIQGGETFHFSTEAQIERVVDEGLSTQLMLRKKQQQTMIGTATDGTRRYLLQNPNVTPLHQIQRRDSLPANLNARRVHGAGGSRLIALGDARDGYPQGGGKRTGPSSPPYNNKPATAPNTNPPVESPPSLRIPKEKIRVHIRKDSSPGGPAVGAHHASGGHHIPYHRKRHSLPVTQMEKLPSHKRSQLLHTMQLGGGGGFSPPKDVSGGAINQNLLERMRLYEEKHKNDTAPNNPPNKIAAKLRQGEIGFNGNIQYG